MPSHILTQSWMVLNPLGFDSAISVVVDVYVHIWHLGLPSKRAYHLSLDELLLPGYWDWRSHSLGFTFRVGPSSGAPSRDFLWRNPFFLGRLISGCFAHLKNPPVTPRGLVPPGLGAFPPFFPGLPGFVNAACSPIFGVLSLGGPPVLGAPFLNPFVGPRHLLCLCSSCFTRGCGRARNVCVSPGVHTQRLLA